MFFTPFPFVALFFFVQQRPRVFPCSKLFGLAHLCIGLNTFVDWRSLLFFSSCYVTKFFYTILSPLVLSCMTTSTYILAFLLSLSSAFPISLFLSLSPALLVRHFPLSASFGIFRATLFPDSPFHLLLTRCSGAASVPSSSLHDISRVSLPFSTFTTNFLLTNLSLVFPSGLLSSFSQLTRRTYRCFFFFFLLFFLAPSLREASLPYVSILFVPSHALSDAVLFRLFLVGMVTLIVSPCFFFPGRQRLDTNPSSFFSYPSFFFCASLLRVSRVSFSWFRILIPWLSSFPPLLSQPLRGWTLGFSLFWSL